MEDKMQQWGMVIDLAKCTRCQVCVVACMVENNVPYPVEDNSLRNRNISWMRMIPMETESGRTLIPRPCLHCDNPPCTKVCPVNATGIDSNGLVRQIYSRCIGCRYCTNACPYTVRHFNWKLPEWPESEKQGLNPDVSIRPMGVVEKCTFCYHRLQRVKDQARFEGREIQDGEYLPACVEACPAKAMFFGDLQNSQSQVSQLIKTTRAFRLLESLGTEPKLYYLSEVKHE